MYFFHVEDIDIRSVSVVLTCNHPSLTRSRSICLSSAKSIFNMDWTSTFHRMPPGADVDTLLSQVVLRGLGDKLYDKRKAAALEVEQLVKTLAREVHISIQLAHLSCIFPILIASPQLLLSAIMTLKLPPLFDREIGHQWCRSWTISSRIMHIHPRQTAERVACLHWQLLQLLWPKENRFAPLLAGCLASPILHASLSWKIMCMRANTENTVMLQDTKKKGEEWAGPDYLAVVVPPVLNSLVDADARVRYYACEALYNIAKVSRDDFLEPHFNCTFDALFRLVADPDPAVNQATTFLDALMKVRPSLADIPAPT